MTAERFRLSAGFEAQQIPFRGAPEAQTEVVAGRVDFFFSPVLVAQPLIKSGQLLALAVSSSTRSSALPDVPTTVEAGYPDSDYDFWLGFFAPAKTPREIVERLHAEIRKAKEHPDVKAKLAASGGEPLDMTPAEFQAYVRKIRGDEPRAREGGRHQAAIGQNRDDEHPRRKPFHHGPARRPLQPRSHRRRALFVSGQLPIAPDGQKLNAATFAEQARQVLANVAHALAAGGSGIEKLLQVRVYVTDIADWPEFNTIYAQWAGAARPARAVVPVPSLHYGFRIEVEAVGLA